jgi:hypothetical protein
MIENAKIQFSAEEMELLKNSDWILTKNRIIEKLSAALEQLAVKVRNEMLAYYPLVANQVLAAGYKISRGEKYQGLPYLILDFPRIFGREDVLAIRVLCWWGKFFSITLHTKGKYAANLAKFLHAARPYDDKLLVSFSGDEWNHNLSHGDYLQFNDAGLMIRVRGENETGFIKLSKRIDLMDWEDAQGEIYSQYHRFLEMIRASFLYDEKGL